MRKLLVICGPTATGKSSLALHLAKQLNGELVSADSRQVYKGMDIGTGKDLPRGFEFRISNLGFKDGGVGYYTDGETRIWGYDLVGPKEEFSVGQYVKVASRIIEDIRARGKLPILVGGTGLYIKGMVDGIPTASIPQDKRLRKSMEDKRVRELFEILAQLDPIRAAGMNASDKKNPRRLIRAIEIAQWQLKRKGKEKQRPLISKDGVLFVGLTAPRLELCKRIEKRVDKRLKRGIEEEIKNLTKMGVSWDDQSMGSLGYNQWKSYFEGEKTKKEMLGGWKKEECRYAKRQMTWFKRDRRINWFDVTKGSWETGVEKLVKRWYSSKHGGD